MILTGKMPVLRETTMSSRFVVQEHTTPDGVHWDLMLERGEVLATFRLDQPPEAVFTGMVRATKMLDHPLRFLKYEGPVQKGTGKVRIVERGTCDALVGGQDAITLRLDGTILRGGFTLMRIEGSSWQFAPRR